MLIVKYQYRSVVNIVQMLIRSHVNRGQSYVYNWWLASDVLNKLAILTTDV